MQLAERATSPSARVRRQAAEVAAELLPALGLDEGRYGPDGTRTGGSPGVEATAAALPDEARAAVAVLGLVADPAVLPTGLPTTARAVGKVLLSGVAAAVGAAGTAAAVGFATGDAARVVTAGITGGAALVGQVAALRADRTHGRLTELLRAAADVRRGLPPDARVVHDRSVAEVLEAMTRDRADAVATRDALDRLDGLVGRPGTSGPTGTPARLARRLAGVTPAATAGRRDRTTSDEARADELGVPTDVRPDATPSRRAWARKASAGPLAAATVTAVGFAVASALGVGVPLTVAGGMVAGLAAVGLVTVVEHAQARLRATLDARRTDVEEARRAARAAAEHSAREAAGRALDARIATELQQAERTAGRLDALQADAAAGRVVAAPGPEAPAAPTGATTTDATSPVDQLVPGPRTGPVDPTTLTDADRARLADLTRALDDVRAASGRGRPAAVARARAVAAALGLDAPLDAGLRTDPDALGWPHRRAALDHEVQLRLAALDELPSAVPAPGWAVAKGLAASVLPSATTAVLGAATLGVAPAVALALAPIALTVSSALAERAAAVAKEDGKRPSSLWSAAAADALADADARRAADRGEAAAALAQQQDENRRRVEDLDRLHRSRRRRLPRTVVPAAAPVPSAPVDADDQVADTPAAAGPPDGRPRYPVAVRRVALPAVAVVTGAVTVFATATNLDATTLVQPGTWDSLGAAALPVLAGSVAVAVSGIASLAAAGGDALAGKSSFDREAARSKAAEARRATWSRIERAALDTVLDTARAQAGADLAEARVDLSATREQLADAVVRSRRPRVLQLVLDRAAALVAAVESALGRPAPSGSPTSEVQELAVLAREAEQLRAAAPDARAERVRELLDGAARLGLLDPGPDAARRRLAVPGPLAAVAAAFVGAAGTVAAVGPVVDDQQFWRWVRTVANTTGWWPEAMCGCPPGTPCTCAAPAQVPGPVTSPVAPATPVPPAPPRRPVPPLPYSPPPALPGQATPQPPTAPTHPAPTHPAPTHPAPTHPAPVTERPVVDVEEWSDGPGRTTSALVTVVAPGGAQVDLLVRWVDPGAGHRPVLVLSDVPGPTFWWGVPVAVQQAAVLALAALRPPTARLAGAVVVGERGGQPPVLSELPVTLGGPAPELVPGRGPRQLDAAETGAAVAALRLRPVSVLLGRLRQVPAGR